MRRRRRTRMRPRPGRPRTAAALRKPRTRSRPRPATPTRTRQPETPDPEAEDAKAAGSSSWSSSSRWPWGWRWRSRPGSSSRTRSPPNRWSRPSTSASGSSSTASSTTSHDPKIGDIVVFHPPAGADERHRMRRASTAPGEPCPKPTPERVEPELHQADRRRARRHALDQGRAPGRQRGREDRRALHQPLRQLPAACNLPKTITIPPDHVLHDGRQPWSKRRQPLLGTRPPRLDHRRGLRHLLAPGPHRRALRPPGQVAPPPAGAQPAPVRLRPRARQPLRRRRRRGRARLPGGAAGRRRGPDRLRGLSHSDRRALSGLHDSKQMTEERRLEMYPCVLRAAARVSVVVRCAAGSTAAACT